MIDHALSLRSGLRAVDALHLSTALLYGEEMTGIATFDRQPAEAARRFGLEVVLGRGWLAEWRSPGLANWGATADPG